MNRLPRAYVRFEKDPSSVRYASAAIVSTLFVLVMIGALASWVFARDEYSSFGEAVWFTLQTITTVGYGDSTPTSQVGRFVASVVMLVSIGLMAVITAGITSLFIRSVSREQQESNHRDLTESLARIEATLASAQERLERIEQSGPAGRGPHDQSD